MSGSVRRVSKPYYGDMHYIAAVSVIVLLTQQSILSFRLMSNKRKLSHSLDSNMAAFARIPKIEGEVRPAIPTRKTADNSPEKNFDNYF